MGRRLCSLSFVLVAGLSSQAMGQEIIAYSFQNSADFSTQFVSWKTKETGQKGHQLFTITQGTTKALWNNVLELDLGLKTGYAISRSTTVGYGGGVSTLTDTVLQLQATYKGWGAFQPFFTTAINLPTGKATLRGNQHRAVMDKDLVYQTRFGEGWNFNPGVGFAYAFSSELTATFGVGYNFRGGYIPDGDASSEYRPGDQLIATTSLSWQTKEYALSLSGTFTQEKDSLLDGFKNFKPGNSYTISGNGMKRWDEQHATSIFGSYTYTARNHSYDFFTNAYTREAQNSNSSVYNIGLQQNYQVTALWGVFARASYLYRDKNLYDPVSNYYVSAKRKLTGELGTSYAIGQNLALNASLGLFHLKQAATPYATALRSRGVVGSVGARVGF